MYREVPYTQLIRNYYLIGVIVFIGVLYTSLFRLFVFNPDQEQNVVLIALFIPLQFSFFMLVWSMVRVIISDPGKVPVYYGVLMDDSETKKRRYCLICHIFKPDRCHHCSTCRRCVLNMDHHCPWIGNCVGYQNRKFFLLFLFYINVTVLQSLIIVSVKLLPELVQLSSQNLEFMNTTQVVEISLETSTLITIIVFGVMIFNFMRFHIGLVSENRTTIDTLEMKRTQAEPATQINQFDVGLMNNWAQVMGKNKWLWLLPIFGESGRPLGDGVHWDRSQQPQVSENNVTNRTNSNLPNANQRVPQVGATSNPIVVATQAKAPGVS